MKLRLSVVSMTVRRVWSLATVDGGVGLLAPGIVEAARIDV
ncbi:hypothetical protein OG592_37870 [Streptomyces avidinii]|nr:hypothetical protein OG592_37870 [Streptomyces avidinii]